MSTEEILKLLNRSTTFVYRKGKIIGGFVTFTENGSLHIEFICTDKLRKGIGSLLMVKVAKYAISNRIPKVVSTVSSTDKRAVGFYKSAGFKLTGMYEGFLHRATADPANILKACRIS